METELGQKCGHAAPTGRTPSLGFQRAWAPYFSSPVSSVNLNQQPGLLSDQGEQLQPTWSARNFTALSLPSESAEEGNTELLSSQADDRILEVELPSYFVGFLKDNTNSRVCHQQEPTAPRFVLTAALDQQTDAFKFPSFT